MKHEDIIAKMTLEEKCFLLSGKDFWQTRSVERLGVHNMVLSDGPHSVVDERTLREIYLTGFEIAVKEGKAKSLMSSYNRVNGTYANENYRLLQEILRDEWGFDGFVVSDWGGSNEHIEGVRAGSHLEMPTTGGNSDLELGPGRQGRENQRRDHQSAGG